LREAATLPDMLTIPAHRACTRWRRGGRRNADCQLDHAASGCSPGVLLSLLGHMATMDTLAALCWSIYLFTQLHANAHACATCTCRYTRRAQHKHAHACTGAALLTISTLTRCPSTHHEYADQVPLYPLLHLPGAALLAMSTLARCRSLLPMSTLTRWCTTYYEHTYQVPRYSL